MDAEKALEQTRRDTISCLGNDLNNGRGCLQINHNVTRAIQDSNYCKKRPDEHLESQRGKRARIDWCWSKLVPALASLQAWANELGQEVEGLMREGFDDDNGWEEHKRSKIG